MSTNTSGGTTTSFMNTPQAVDDYFGEVHEDYIYCFDVMANDLGGNAKILWSIDDATLDGTTGVSGSGDGTYDLLKQDAALCPEKSDKGARIWIEAGKIKYDASAFNYLAAGQCITDTFTYAIRLSNGTLSWATVTITVTGTNDAATIGGNSAGDVNEDGQLTTGGTLTISDVDTGEAELVPLTDAAGVNGYGTFQVGANGVWSYTLDNGLAAVQQLPAGETLTDTITVTSEDGTATQQIVVTIHGTNDAPALTGAPFVFPDGTEDTPYTVTEAQLLQGFTDIDGDDLAVSALTAVNGTVVDNGDGTYTVTPTPNYAGTVTLNFNVIDGNGGSVAASNGVFFESVNDPATFNGTFSGSVTEATSSNPGTPTATGNVTFEDVDELNAFFQQVVAPQLSTSGYGYFTLTQTGTWTYTLDNSNPTVEALNTLGTLNDSFIIRSSDGTEQVISITINGATDFAYVSPTVFNGTGDPNDFDTLVGGAVNNTSNISGSNGNDTITGGSANQTITGSNGNDTIYGAGGDDDINGGNDNDTLYGQTGSDTVDGNNGLDALYGGAGNDSLTGGNDVDMLFGGSGADTINGSGGNDRIVGGYGADTLSGGGNADTFVYLSNLDTGDTITDFVAGTDDIDLAAFAPNSFVGAITQAGAVGANEVGYMFAGGVTTVYVDTDGVYGADLEIKLTGNITLTVNDFILGP